MSLEIWIFVLKFNDEYNNECIYKTKLNTKNNKLDDVQIKVKNFIGVFVKWILNNKNSKGEEKCVFDGAQQLYDFMHSFICAPLYFGLNKDERFLEMKKDLLEGLRAFWPSVEIMDSGERVEAWKKKRMIFGEGLCINFDYIFKGNDCTDSEKIDFFASLFYIVDENFSTEYFDIIDWNVDLTFSSQDSIIYESIENKLALLNDNNDRKTKFLLIGKDEENKVSSRYEHNEKISKRESVNNKNENMTNEEKAKVFGKKLDYMLEVMLAAISDKKLKYIHDYLKSTFATVSKEMVKWPEEKTKEIEKKLDDILDLMSATISVETVKCTEEGAKEIKGDLMSIIIPIFNIVGEEMKKVKWTKEDKKEVKKIEKMGYLEATEKEIKEVGKIVKIWSEEKVKGFEKELDDILKPILATVSEEMENKLGNPIDKELICDTHSKLSEIRNKALKNLKLDNKDLISELEKDLAQLRYEGRFVANKVLKYEVVTAKSKVIENVFIGVIGKYDNKTKKYEGGRLHELDKWVSEKNTFKQNKIDKKPRTEKDKYYEKKGQ